MRMSARAFFKMLVDMGYGDVDPELLLYHFILEGDNAAWKKLLEKPEWKTGEYNMDITDKQLIRRYKHLLKNLLGVAWAQKRLRENQG